MRLVQSQGLDVCGHLVATHVHLRFHMRDKRTPTFTVVEPVVKNTGGEETGPGVLRRVMTGMRRRDTDTAGGQSLSGTTLRGDTRSSRSKTWK